MFKKPIIELERRLAFEKSYAKSLRFQIKRFENGDAYKDSWKIQYLESLLEIQKLNKGMRRLKRRLDKQILKNKETKP